jgi:hypothetical protein
MPFLTYLYSFFQWWPNLAATLLPVALIILDFVTGVLAAMRMKTFDLKVFSDIFGSNSDFQKYLAAEAGIIFTWFISGQNIALTTSAGAFSTIVVLSPTIIASIVSNCAELFNWTPQQKQVAQAVGQGVQTILGSAAAHQQQQQPPQYGVPTSNTFAVPPHNPYGIPPTTPPSTPPPVAIDSLPTQTAMPAVQGTYVQPQFQQPQQPFYMNPANQVSRDPSQ